jgi:hypothetical protein
MPNQIATLRLSHAYHRFTRLIDSLSDSQFLSPMEGWAPRDVVAHLIGWNSLMIESSLSIIAGKPPSYYDDAPNDFSNINSSFTAKYSSSSKQELLAELQSSMEKLKKFIYALPIEELMANYGIMHYSGVPATITKIIHSLAGDYQYHTRQIEEWLTNQEKTM